MSRVHINVSGVHFEFNNDILKNYKFDKLSEMCDDASKNGKPLDLTVDRSSECFAAILSFYQTSELHMPTGVCPGQFKKELEYWEVDSDNLAKCCLYRYHSFLDELETRKKFLDEVIHHSSFAPVPYPAMTSGKTFLRFKTRLWNIVDYREKSIIARVYFIALMLMVFLSVINMAFSTVPRFRRSLSKCEYLEYLEHKKHPMFSVVKARFGEIDCSKESLGHSGDKVDSDYMDTWYYYMYDELSDFFDYMSDYSDDYGNTTINTTESTNITDTAGVNATSLLDKAKQVQKQKKLTVPYVTVRIFIFDVIDYVILGYFTLDLLLRLFSCPSWVRYFTSFVNIIEFCAVIGGYTNLIIISIEKQYRYEQSWLRIFEYFQVFRALRLFRLVRNVRASKVLEYSLRQNVKDGMLLLVLMLVGISTFATLFYLIEGENVVDSIPRAWYWSVITMTTVGYGDISPTTSGGMVLASVCACCGVILLAVALPMFVNNFLTLYQYSCIDEIQEQHKATKQKFKNAIHTVSLAAANLNMKKHTNVKTINVKP